MNKMIKFLVKSLLVKVLSLIFVSIVLLLVSLWQIEIIFIYSLLGWTYCLPFHIVCSNDYFYWRDVFYVMNITAFILLILAIILLLYEIYVLRRTISLRY
jgi:hypothetical protein